MKPEQIYSLLDFSWRRRTPVILQAEAAECGLRLHRDDRRLSRAKAGPADVAAQCKLFLEGHDAFKNDGGGCSTRTAAAAAAFGSGRTRQPISSLYFALGNESLCGPGRRH